MFGAIAGALDALDLGLGLALHRDRAGWRVEITPELLNQRLAGLGVLNDQLPVGNGIGESSVSRSQQDSNNTTSSSSIRTLSARTRSSTRSRPHGERHHMVQPKRPAEP